MTKSFFTVAIGASAGGLSPLIDFFDHIPININCAFVVITHLKRDHRSSLDELLSKHTSLPLIRMEKDMQLEVGNIYLLIENTAVKITNGYLKVEARDDKVANSSVNIFFKSLADDCGEMGIDSFGLDRRKISKIKFLSFIDISFLCFARWNRKSTCR